MGEGLDELERRGRAARQAQEAAEDARRHPRHQGAGLQLSTLYFATQLFAIGCVLLVIGGAIVGWYHPTLGDRLLWPMGGLLLAAVVAPLVGRLLAPAALVRERQWAARLPFRLVGYFEGLERVTSRKSASGPHFAQQTSSCTLRLDFDRPPPAGYLEDLAAGLDEPWLRAGSRHLTLLGVGDARTLYARLHSLCDRVLLPLHARHPIGAVTVEVEAP